MRNVVRKAMVGLMSLALMVPAAAKTITAGGTDNERVVSTLSGPSPTPSQKKQSKDTSHKKSKVKSPPPLHDPN